MQDSLENRDILTMVSIIIVAMGDSRLLHECISSIREHLACPFELILVNNSPIPLKLPEEAGACIIENRCNLGFARAVNRGIEAAKGSLILLLNPDARLTSDIVTPMNAFLSSRSSAGIAGIQLFFPDGSAQNSIDIIPNLITQFLNKSLLKILFPRIYPSKRSQFPEPVQVPSVIGACMMIKREVIDAIGLLDEGFFLYLEETDYCKRATDEGFEIWHLPGLQVVHHQGTSARIVDMARKIEFHRSMYRFFRKHRGDFQTAFLYVLTIVKSLIETGANLVLCITPKGSNRLKKSAVTLAWHALGQPERWGLEDIRTGLSKVRKNGYTWFLAKGTSIPDQVTNPKVFMDEFKGEVLNRSRTTFVKTGMLDGRTIFLKRYNFKGIRDTIKNLFRKSRARRSFEAALLLHRSGINTPGVEFACEKRICGILIESYIATTKINAVDLVGYVKTRGCDNTLLKRLARFVRQLHEMGIVHVDFKGENILVSEHGFYLIDLDRLKRVPRLNLNAIAKNLSYLNASFARDIPCETRLIFLDEYLKGNTWLADKGRQLSDKVEAYTQARLARRYNE
ncbi:MAG: glycosyltransferase [Deltaproteobacteria bacterium]|nr:glycosyltransferase [Deltaproteobacteria bacterium]